MYVCIYIYISTLQSKQWPVLVAGRSKAKVCGRQPAEIVGSNLTGGMDVCCECCVLSGRGLCDKLISRPEESQRLWCVVECDLETSWIRRPWPTVGCCAKWKIGKSTHQFFYEVRKKCDLVSGGVLRSHFGVLRKYYLAVCHVTHYLWAWKVCWVNECNNKTANERFLLQRIVAVLWALIKVILMQIREAGP